MNRMKGSRSGMIRKILAVICLVSAMAAQVSVQAASNVVPETGPDLRTTCVSAERLSQNNVKKPSIPAQQETEQRSRISALPEEQVPDGEKADAQAVKFLGVEGIPLLILTGLDVAVALAILSVVGVFVWKRLGSPGF